jgi:hypothetical protein
LSLITRMSMLIFGAFLFTILSNYIKNCGWGVNLVELIYIAGSYNGSTTDSESVYHGSNPCPAARSRQRLQKPQGEGEEYMFYGNKLNLIQYAKTVIQGKINALQNDAGLCLIGIQGHYQPAPFTALLACFSLLDLLAAFHGGNASSSASTTASVKAFLKKYFSYNEDQRELLLKMYRHKLVHLFQPGIVVEYKNHTYSWSIHHSQPLMHLKILPNTRPSFNPVPSVRIKLQYIFSISIQDLMNEIISAASKYLEDLEKEPTLQTKFENAISQIFKL